MAKQDTLSLLELAVYEAGESLRGSFAAYWPTSGDTGAHEHNLSLHIGGALLRSGFAVFGEGHADGEADTRYDLLAYSKDSGVFVACEFKQLWSKGTARSMRNDVERVLDFAPVRRRALEGGTTQFGLIAALSEDDERFRQIMSPSHAGPCDATRALLAVVPDGSRWRSTKICDHGRHPDRAGTLHLLFVLFPVQSGPRAVAG